MDGMTSEPIIIEESLLQAGDVLLGYSTQMMDYSGCETGYGHAAIHLGSGEILESSIKGVRKISIGDFLRDYEHIAAIRAKDVWSKTRTDALQNFALRNIGKRFNREALPTIEFLRQESIANSLQKIIDYFSGRAEPVRTNRETFFCSELVVSAFIDVGIISESAAILFEPETLMPIDIAQDKVFGFFFGYIPKNSDYVIPENDWFRSNI